MNFLKSLLGGVRRRGKPAGTPVQVRRRAQVAATIAPGTNASGPSAKDDRIPDYLDFDDTMELEGSLATASDEDDPYQTQTWELEPETETRKLKQPGVGKKRIQTDPNNPYNSGIRRRGWKG